MYLSGLFTIKQLSTVLSMYIPLQMSGASCARTQTNMAYFEENDQGELDA